MWIRSQGGTILIDCDSFAVEDHSGKYEVITLHGKSGISVSLGIYTTKGKALNVLNEIQKAIEGKQFRTIENVALGDYVLHEGIQVYEMPQDDDFEE